MQEELLARADKIFDWIGQSMDKVGDLAIQGGKAVAEQVPDIAMQYVAYGRVTLTVYIVLGLFSFFIAYYSFFRVGLRDSMKLGMVQTYGGKDWHPLRIGMSIVGGAFGLIAGGLLVFVNLKEFVLVWFAPKVWLMMELVQLVKMVKS